MSHFAELNENNVVLRVLVCDNDDPNDDEGYQWLIDNLGGRWVQTSYNTQGGVHSQGGTPLRNNYAGIGYTYDSGSDAFIPPKPYTSWLLNETTCQWDAPTAMPVVEGKMFKWDEPTTSWVEIVAPA